MMNLLFRKHLISKRKKKQITFSVILETAIKSHENLAVYLVLLNTAMLAHAQVNVPLSFFELGLVCISH